MSLKLCVHFTFGMSLKTWDQVGMLSREILLYKELQKKGVDITFITYGDESDKDYAKDLPGVRILPLFSQQKGTPSKLRSLWHSLLFPFRNAKLLNQFDVLKTNQMLGGWMALLGAKLYGKKLCVRCGYELYELSVIEKQKPWKLKILHALSKLTYRQADHIILTSDHIAQQVAKRFHVDKDKITVLPNFIDTDLFKPNKVSEIPTCRVLFIGRLHFHKNLKNLIQACYEANLGLDLVGEGEQKPELESLQKSLGADVNFLGRIPNDQLPDLINRYSIFVLPSISEGCPKSLLEAMSCGLAVIGSNVNGINNIIKHGLNGLLCELDAASIKKQLLLLKRDPQLQDRLGMEARSYISKHCSVEHTVDTELAIYGQKLGLV